MSASSELPSNADFSKRAPVVLKKDPIRVNPSKIFKTAMAVGLPLAAIAIGYKTLASEGAQSSEVPDCTPTEPLGTVAKPNSGTADDPEVLRAFKKSEAIGRIVCRTTPEQGSELRFHKDGPRLQEAYVIHQLQKDMTSNNTSSSNSTKN